MRSKTTPPDQLLSERLQFVTTPAQAQEIREHAESLDVTVSTALRRLVTAGLERQGGADD